MIIGLSVNHKDGTSRITDAYVNAVVKAGGSPVLIPLTTDQSVLEEIINHIDGLLLSGGGDIYAPLFNEELHPTVTDYDLERDRYEIELVRMTAARQIPIMGICRGQQLLNVAFGGNLIQDIPAQLPASNIRHSQEEEREIATHAVHIAPHSTLHKLSGGKSIKVNSFHHQAIKVVAPEFEVIAEADDGVIEAIESAESKAILGVQWHPENMAMAGDQFMIDTIKYLVNEADLFNKAKALHKKIYTIDSHCDTPMFFPQGIDIGKKNKQTKVDIPKMQEGMLDAVFMVAYLPQGARTAAASQKAFDKAVSIINQIKQQAEKNKDLVAVANSVEELKKNKAEGKKTIFIGIENGYAIGKDIRNVEHFARMGVKYITLSHNGDNDICDSNRGNREHKGLSEFGREVVHEMNRLGIMVDISHTSEKTSFDVLEISQYPVIASHSSVKALCNHPRNISDKLMKAIAAKGGLIQICFYKGFLKKDGQAKLKDAIDHIDYVVKTVGVDYVGIGTDFDGDGGIPGAQNASEAPQITLELLRRGYSDEDIAKIWGGNLIRVMEAVKKEI
ncbi:MAG: gamma-glutamyl-gamma-aminobutyrate hydrolase family protein [Candidatus Symbiothrix sp.]|nr:gamma-glutamyl-gamma-aminobutyrate hydrolase family protein [Candidatus Symbiothrix sp.]